MALQIGGIEVLLRPAASVEAQHSNYKGLHPSTTILPKGFKRDPSCRAFQVDTIWDRDIEVPMRDGTKLRADAFRPAASTETVPVLMAFSPYGKSGSGCFSLDIVQGRMGVGKERLSGFQNFESFDPAEWTAQGYAVVNVDARGIFDSEGVIRWYGTAEGRDGHDSVEFFGQLPWCNGHVALIGNSWLATTQWFIAAERPPHLSCIMPLEGMSDVYRETLCRGGVPYTPFWDFVANNLFGRTEQEDSIGMLKKYPLMNNYWEDKRAKAYLINIPAYVLASMSTGLHTIGSTRCFEDIPHDKKWLRLHPNQEWYDLYKKDSVDDFKKFLDFYTKGIPNGWEETPRARVSILRYNESPIVNVPFKNWPVPETELRRFYLCEEAHLSPDKSPTSTTISYRGDEYGQQADNDPEEVSFVHTFEEQATLIGTSKAVLWVSCPEHDDLDIFVQLRKADKAGKVLRNMNIPPHEIGCQSEDEVDLINSLVYLGPTGVLRASHRAIDPMLSKPHWPAHDHTQLQKIPPGQVVRLEIGLWPGAMHFEKGEKLIFKVSGHSMTLAEFAPLRGQFKTQNIGQHVLHFGGQYDSRIEIQTIEI